MATFYNQATLTYRGGTVNSNIVSATLTEAITVSKTATTDNYRIGERLTYTVGIVNGSDMPVTSTSVTDDLGGYAFGVWHGTMLYLIGAFAGSLIVFLFVRKFGKTAAEIFFSREKLDSLAGLKISRRAREEFLNSYDGIPMTAEERLAYLQKKNRKF